MTIESPCMGCLERHRACWDTCEKYKAYKQAGDKIKKAKRKQIDLIELGVERRTKSVKIRKLVKE